jgi:nitroimidazol reductase NimA-like FMN-containing flavoprotein (pyridoxamine 5'-phosphate oxidase superfamily)
METRRKEGAEGRAELRRSDRGVDDEAWMRALLERTPVGVLGTTSGGQPFLNSNLFVYAPEERESRACFTAFEMGRVLPADRALEFSTEYGGVVLFGRISVVESEDEAQRALQMLMDKYAPHLRPGSDYEAATPADLKRTSVFKLAIEEWSGKRKQAPRDFAGAYRFDDVRPRDGD